MRTLLFASAAMLAIAGGAQAQNAPNNPKSGSASNIDQSTTRSAIAPSLPTAGASGSAEDYLQRAERAVKSGRTGEAQEALERAETRILDRSTTPDAASQPDTSPRVDAIRKALAALAHRDRPGALSAIQTAMNDQSDSGAAMPAGGTAAMPAQPAAMPTPVPSGGAQPGSGSSSANGVAVNPAGGSNSPSGGQAAPAPVTQ